MTQFQKIMIGLGSILVIAVCALVVMQVSDKIAPQLTHEEKLAMACEEHPVECEKMRMVHAQTEAMERQAEQYGPGVASSIADLRRVQKEYDERFIAEGYYGDAR